MRITVGSVKQRWMSSISVVLSLTWAIACVAAGCSSSPGGNPGAAGTTGSGAAGTTATAGTNGAAGTNAAAGTNGAAGTNVAGTNGAAGTSAVAGTSGAAGRGGTTGAAGTQGAGGTTAAGGTSASGGTGGTTAGGGRGGTIGAGGTTSGGGTSGGWKCPAGPFTNPTSAMLTPARVTGVPPFDSFNNDGNNYGNIEGAAWAGDALYVSEIASGNGPPPSRILRIDANGAVSIAIADAGSNGIAIDATGRLVTANHKYGAITAYSPPSTTPTQLVQTFMGSRFDSPNDLAIRSDGTIYFSDPDYQSMNGGPQTKQRVYKVAPGSTTATVVDENRQQPNGVTLSLDEMSLFVSGGDGIFKYPIDAQGNAGTGVRFANNVSSGDGMVMDCAGNLYVAANGNVTLMVLSPTGTMVASTQVQGITNVAFGGGDHKTLYVTAMGNGKQGSNPGPEGVFKIAMPLPGMPY